MEALINYKGQQILLTEGDTVKVPYQKDLKPGSTMEFNEVLYFFDGKKRQVGNPYIKSLSLVGKVDSHFRDSKVVVFKKKRRKGYRVKNGHRQFFTELLIESVSEKADTKKAEVKSKKVKEVKPDSKALKSKKVTPKKAVSSKPKVISKKKLAKKK